jgi:Excalibur calcium-binding domain
MTPHIRESAQLSATASLSPTLSVSSARRLRGHIEQVDARDERRGRGFRGVLATAVILSLLAVAVASVQLTNGWPLSTTLRHFAAAPGCAAARAVGLAPARTGEPGYWPWLDPNHDGIACKTEPR